MFIRKRHLFRSRVEASGSREANRAGEGPVGNAAHASNGRAPASNGRSENAGGAPEPAATRGVSLNHGKNGQPGKPGKSSRHDKLGKHGKRSAGRIINLVLRPQPILAFNIHVKRIIFNAPSGKPPWWSCLEAGLNAVSTAEQRGGNPARQTVPPMPLEWKLDVLRPGSPAGHSRKRSLAEASAISARRLRLRLLVLQAKRIPYQYEQDTGTIFVPRLYLGVAAHEILAFESEREEEARSAPGKDNWLWVLAFLSLLLFWDALRHGSAGWGLHFLPQAPDVWVELGALAKARVLDGEWWRVLTALTLHADASHVLGNCVFGALFMLPLCSRAGLGGGVFMTVMGGALGNALNIFFQSDFTRSIGFSTAVFAALGALCGLAAHGLFAGYARKKPLDERRFFQAPGMEYQYGRTAGAAMTADRLLRARARGVFLCLAAGLAFLAFLGGSGEPRVDFSAHALGLLGGLLVALPLAPFLRHSPPQAVGPFKAGKTRGAPVVSDAPAEPLYNDALTGRRAQFFLLLFPLGLLALSWYLAFSKG